MAYNRGTEAYDYNRMNSRGSAAPAKQPQRRPQRAPKPKLIRRSRAQIKAEQKATRARTIKALAVCALLFSLVAFQIYSQVKVDELDRELKNVETSISVLESENTRLNMELDSRISLEKVDDYAQNVLGMVKVENYQVSYVDLASANSIEVSGDKEKHKPLEAIKAFLN